MWAAKVQASLRIRAVSPEPPLLAHTSSESWGTFRQKARSLAPLNGWACAVKICHDGMLEDTNSLDAAHLMLYRFRKNIWERGNKNRHRSNWAIWPVLCWAHWSDSVWGRPYWTDRPHWADRSNCALKWRSCAGWSEFNRRQTAWSVNIRWPKWVRWAALFRVRLRLILLLHKNWSHVNNEAVFQLKNGYA